MLISSLFRCCLRVKNHFKTSLDCQNQVKNHLKTFKFSISTHYHSKSTSFPFKNEMKQNCQSPSTLYVLLGSCWCNNNQNKVILMYLIRTWTKMPVGHDRRSHYATLNDASEHILLWLWYLLLLHFYCCFKIVMIIIIVMIFEWTMNVFCTIRQVSHASSW